MFRQRQEFRIYPTDTKPNVAIGVKFPFNKTKAFDSTYTTNEQIKSNLMVFMLTNRGERIFNPDFGADIRSYQFEQLTSFDELRSSILDRVSFYFPQITVVDLKFTTDNDNNSLFIIFTYMINKTQDSITIQIN